jgi:hypothetical protein
MHAKLVAVRRDAAGFAEFLAKENERWGALISARNIEIP